ncbi:MAG: hypothetical protein KME43_18325 [Myxacorys chilensis ATA2-1-KO14]|nr:hypothetical protein [Myxacorys chilensis ATA2-1-KO14]
MAAPSLFKWCHVLPDIIFLKVRRYCRYPSSYRDLEAMMAERGHDFDSSLHGYVSEVVCRVLARTSTPSDCLPMLWANNRRVGSLREALKDTRWIRMLPIQSQ